MVISTLDLWWNLHFACAKESLGHELDTGLRTIQIWNIRRPCYPLKQ